MAFHINPQTGNPGPCGAQEGNCPFGGKEDHYDSMAEATKAYEQSMGSGFEKNAKCDCSLSSGRKGVGKDPAHCAVHGDVKEMNMNHRMLVHLDPLGTAKSSTDPEELYAAAEMADTEIAHALRNNSYADAATLVKARSRGDDLDFVLLESHPTYPVAHMTRSFLTGWEGLNRGDTFQKFRSDEVNDEVTRLLVEPSMMEQQVQGKSLEAAVLAFENPNNKLSGKFVREVAVNHPTLAAAAAKSGRFPTNEDMLPETEVTYFKERETVLETDILPHAEPGASFERARRGPLDANVLTIAAEHSPDYSKVYYIAKRFKGTDHEATVAKAIRDNKNLDVFSKKAIGDELEIETVEAVKPTAPVQVTVERRGLFSRFRR